MRVTFDFDTSGPDGWHDSRALNRIQRALSIPDEEARLNLELRIRELVLAQQGSYLNASDAEKLVSSILAVISG